MPSHCACPAWWRVSEALLRVCTWNTSAFVKWKFTNGLGTKPNYLIALSNILRNVPTSVITPELPNLLPLLLQSAELPDADVKAATIETLHVTIKESADSLKEHVSSVITRLLNACTLETEGSAVLNPPRVRTAALRALRSFPGSIRGELLLPYKRQVLKRLLPVLDDPKRTVRKEVRLPAPCLT